MSEPQIYLASSSPRRQHLLRQIGVRFELVAMDINEQPHTGEEAAAFARRMALDKARSGQTRMASPRLPVLGADTVLSFRGEILGKPRDREHGLVMLEMLSGETHEVISGVAVVADREEVRVQTSRVTFREITGAEREAYWETAEPSDKAGGYGIQGLGAVFISRLEGSYSGVMGLPLYETWALLRLFGVNVL